MDGAGGVGYVAALVGGVLALLSPCGALLLPSFFAYAFEQRSQLLARTGIFYLGLITTLVPLGVSASTLTTFVRSNQQTVMVIAGLAIIALGILTALGGGFAVLSPTKGTAEGATSPWSVYALGLTYGLAGFCTGPILGSILVLAAAGGQPLKGGLLLAVYALGMVVPLVLLATLWGRLGERATRWLRGRTVTIAGREFHSTSLISGLLMVLVGAFLIINGGNLVESSQLALAGARVEEWATRAGGYVTDEVLALIGLAAAATWFVVRWRRDAEEPEPEPESSDRATPERTG